MRVKTSLFRAYVGRLNMMSGEPLGLWFMWKPKEPVPAWRVGYRDEGFLVPYPRASFYHKLVSPLEVAITGSGVTRLQ